MNEATTSAKKKKHKTKSQSHLEDGMILQPIKCQKSQFLVFNQLKVLALQYHSMQETLYSVILLTPLNIQVFGGHSTSNRFLTILLIKFIWMLLQKQTIVLAKSNFTKPSKG